MKRTGRIGQTGGCFQPATQRVLLLKWRLEVAKQIEVITYLLSCPCGLAGADALAIFATHAWHHCDEPDRPIRPDRRLFPTCHSEFSFAEVALRSRKTDRSDYLLTC